MASLGFAGFAFRREQRSRAITERLQLLEQHRELWSKVHEHKELKRIKEPNLDLVGEPVTALEREFLNMIFIHFETGWRLAELGSVNSLDTIRTDVKTFFRLPLPAAVWAETKDLRNDEFRRFVDDCLSKKN